MYGIFWERSRLFEVAQLARSEKTGGPEMKLRINGVKKPGRTIPSRMWCALSSCRRTEVLSKSHKLVKGQKVLQS